MILLPLGDFASTVMPLFENRRFITAASSAIGSITKSVLAAVFPFSKKQNGRADKSLRHKDGALHYCGYQYHRQKYIAAVTGCVLSIVAP